MHHYRVERDTTLLFGVSTVEGTVVDTTYTALGLGLDGTYYFRVFAVDAAGFESEPGDTVVCIPLDLPPAAPSGLLVESGGIVTLSWSPNPEPDVNGYCVYRDTVPDFGPEDLLATVPPSGSFGDTTGVLLGFYWYCVTATDAAGQESPFSDAVLGLHTPGSGGSLFVDGDYSGYEQGTIDQPYNTIQEALDAASDEACVVVSPGIYSGGLSLTKELLIVGMFGAEQSIVLSPSATVLSAQFVGSGAGVIGLTLDGGGTAAKCIDCNTADLIVDQCVIREAGTGVEARGGSRPTLTDNAFLGLSTALACADSARPSLMRNTFSGSEVANVSSSGAPGPFIGGSLADANDFLDAGMFMVLNMAPCEMDAEHNYWGSSCPDSGLFIGDVRFAPWTDSTHVEVFAECTETGVEDEQLPTRFALSHGFPNPFNPVTRFFYDVPSPGARVSLSVYNQTGRLVRTIADRAAPPGRHMAVWDGTDHTGVPVASGVYFCRYEAEGHMEERKVVLLK